MRALDRVLLPSGQYPFDYGFGPSTLAEEGSPLDAMVVMEEPSFPSWLILTRAIGLLELLDADIYDGKLPWVSAHDPHLETMVSIWGSTTEILGWQEG